MAACGGGGSNASPSTSAPAHSPVASLPTAAAPSIADTLGPPAVDGERALAHVRKLAVDIGPRVAGTEGAIAARDYLRSTLAGYGYDVALQEFRFSASDFRSARLDVGPAPGPSSVTSIPAISLRGSGDETVEGRRLIVAGIGRPDDFPAAGLDGAIALIERGDLTFAQKVRNAIAAGASAVVIYNNVPERFVFNLGDDVTVPAVAIDQAAGQDLVAKIGAQPQEARVTVSPLGATAYNVVAKPKRGALCETVSGGHYDGVPMTGAADDNAAGTATVLELARVVAALKLPARHCFVLFSAEEFGLYGSKIYVGQLDAAERTALRGMLNLDAVGTASGLDLIGSADLIEVARLAARKIGIEARASSLPPNMGSDHVSFQKADIPAVMLYREDNLIHTPQDSIERIVAGSLADTVSVALGTLQSLAPDP